MPCLYVLLCGPKILNKDSCLVFFVATIQFNVKMFGNNCCRYKEGTKLHRNLKPVNFHFTGHQCQVLLFQCIVICLNTGTPENN